MTRRLSLYTLVLGVACLTACKDKDLAVTNPNAGDTKRVLATPVDAENLLGTYFKRWHGGWYGNTGTIGTNPPTTFEGMANVMSLQNFSSLANNCQNIRTPFTSAANVNTPGNPCAGEQYNPYSVMGEVERVASNFLGVVDGFGTFTPAQIARDKAFAEFLRGLSLGYLAMFYDSAAVVTKGMDPLDPGKLVGYKQVMDSAYAALQRSIDNTNAAVAAGAFTLPGAWVPSPTVFNSVEFIKMIRSYRARFRAGVARNPTDRGAVDWASVIADAQAGFTNDHLLSLDATNGPFSGWRRIYDPPSASWHQMPPFIIGMADTSGNYETWLGTPLGARGAGGVGYFMATPDLRFPQGSTRAAQQADFKIQDCEINGGQVTGAGIAASCKRYFSNRTAADPLTGAGWGWSNYDFARFHWFFIKGASGSPRTGDLLFFPKTELDMLQAEGLIRTGAFAQAAALINLTRQKNGLPAITAFDGTSPVPGGIASCVPRIPVGPSFTTTACGNMFEAMKWEKRMETAYTSVAPWYIDGRGWGDLPEATATFWPVPYQELQVRGYSLGAIYGAGPGVGNAPNSVAPKSTYGW